MMYYEVTIGEKEYKLRLDARSAVTLEKKLGKSPLSILANENKELPKLEDMILMLHASLQKYNAGMTIDSTYDLYDEYVNEGYTFAEDFIPLVMEIFKVSGFFKEKAKVKVEGAEIIDAEVIEEKK